MNQTHEFQNTTLSTDESLFINEAVNKNLFFKHLLKEEHPFGEPSRNCDQFIYGVKGKSYQIRSLPYIQLAEKFEQYKADGKLESAIKCCHIKRIIQKSLMNKEDLQALADLCEIALE